MRQERCSPPRSSIQLLLQNQLRSSRLKDTVFLDQGVRVEIIAIGNGTPAVKVRAFVAEVLHDHPGVRYVIVNESGASVYSASGLARHEFPELTVENARPSPLPVLARSLAELVKIDAKSIGVGQYQHDVNQKN